MEIKDNLNRAQIKFKCPLFKVTIRWNVSTRVDRSGRLEKETTTTNFEIMWKEVLRNPSR